MMSTKQCSHNGWKLMQNMKMQESLLIQIFRQNGFGKQNTNSGKEESRENVSTELCMRILHREKGFIFECYLI